MIRQKNWKLIELFSRNLPVKGEEELEHGLFLHKTEVLDGGNDALFRASSTGRLVLSRRHAEQAHGYLASEWMGSGVDWIAGAVEGPFDDVIFVP